jgi:hypothetical protein
MKFAVKINERKLLLTATQVEDLVDLISGCEDIHEQYRGDGKGNYGSNNNYDRKVRCTPVDEWFDARAVPDELIATLKLAEKLQEGS